MTCSSNKLNGMGLGAVDKPGSLRTLLRGTENEVVLQEWDGFVQDTLHSILDHQIVGSYSALANLSALSQVCAGSISLFSVRKCNS